MKKLYTLFLSLTAAIAFSQIPNLINYQGAVRSPNGEPIINKNIALRFEILNGATTFYSEDQSGVPVNGFGVFSTQIGKNGNIPANWANGTYSLKVSVDTLNGNAFVAMGSQQLVSVPFALNAPSPTVSITNSTLLTVGNSTAQLPAQGGLQTLSSNSNSISISGTNTVVIPPPSLTPAGGGVSITPNGNYGYTINTPSVSLKELRLSATPPTSISGIAQVLGTYPDYTVVVAPLIAYDQNTGYLTLSNNPSLSFLGATGVYTVSYDITPGLAFASNSTIIRSGPITNSINIANLTPWRYSAPNTVTVANTAWNVGLGTNVANAKLHVDGFTKLGESAPAIQVMTISAQTAVSANSSITATIPNYILQSVPTTLSPNKIISVSVLVQDLSGNWVPPGNNVLAGASYNWHLASGGIVITNGAASSNILNQPAKITIMYVP